MGSRMEWFCYEFVVYSLGSVDVVPGCGLCVVLVLATPFELTNQLAEAQYSAKGTSWGLVQ